MKKIERFVIYPILIAVFIIFTFFDFQIANSLYSPGNLFGQLGEALGEAPFQLLCVFASALLFRFRDRSTKARNIGFGILFGFFIFAFCGYGGGMIRSYTNRMIASTGVHLGIWFMIPVGLVYFGLAAPIAFFIKIDDENVREAKRWSIFVVALYVTILVAMNLIKVFWLRPRFRTLMDVYYPVGGLDMVKEQFRSWYQPQGFWSLGKYKAFVEENGIDFKMSMDEVMSFPSGHTMNATGILVLSLASGFLPKLKGKEWWIRIIIYVWAAGVAISRVVRGAHYATDVTMGYLIGILLFDIGVTFIYPRIFKGKETEPAELEQAE